MNRYRPASSFGNAPLAGFYYVSSMIAEANVFALIEGSGPENKPNGGIGTGPGDAGRDRSLTTTSGAAHLPGLTDCCVDYIFHRIHPSAKISITQISFPS